MNFQTSNGNAMSARQAWHDAFVSGVGSIDTREVLNTLGVQFTAKGGGSCTMEHCDKGKIQQAIHNLRMKSLLAWAWGMYAYAPDGTENVNLLKGILFPHAMRAVTNDAFNPFLFAICGDIVELALNDAKVEANTDKRLLRRSADMSEALCCSEDEYIARWRPIFFIMKDSLRELSAVALPPIAQVVWLIVDKQCGEPGASVELQKAMKTKAVA